MPNGSSLNLLASLTAELNARDEELLHRKEQLERVMDTLPGLFLILRGQTIVDANQAAFRILGDSRDELLGKTTCDMVHPDDKDRTIDAHDNRTGEAVDGSLWFRNRWVTKGGQSVLLDWSGWQDDANVIFAFARVVSDVDLLAETLLAQDGRAT